MSERPSPRIRWRYWLTWLFAWFWFLLIVGGITALGLYESVY